jgi:hypothetical protein
MTSLERRSAAVAVKDAILIAAVGYAFIVASALVISVMVRLLTGYFPSFTYFTLALITLRLVELHYGALLAPPLVAAAAMLLLLKTPLDRRIAAALAMSSFYIIVTLIYLLVGAADLPLAASAPSVPWIGCSFLAGLGASVVVDRLSGRR